MAMSNAELEVALKAALQRLVTALANKVAPDSLLLEGKSLAEITSLILAGKAATAGTADNALAVGGKDLTTIESERNAQLVAAIDALRTELETRFPKLHMVGRNGMHRYNNQDHAMMTALLTARNIIGGKKIYDAWLVNEDAEYHEERACA